MSVKSYGNIFDPSKPSPAVNILFERVTIVSRNFAIGGSVSAGVNQVLYNLPAPVLVVVLLQDSATDPSFRSRP